MAAMKTQLNLIAEPGDYAGKNMEINGDGYAGMNFAVHAVPREDFAAWVRGVQVTPRALDDAAYADLAAPSKDVPPAFYSSVRPGLFEAIVAKPAAPPSIDAKGSRMPGMQ
jgi:cytochrome o ubiquinol oxidase subunit 2